MQMQRAEGMQRGMPQSAGMFSSEDKAMFSKGAQRMEQLSQLAQEDPEAFKEATADIADKLEERRKQLLQRPFLDDGTPGAAQESPPAS